LFSLVPSPCVSVKVWFFSHRGSAKKIRGLLLTKKYVLGSGSVPRRQVLLVKPANENLAHPYSTHTTSQPQPFYSSREKKQATRAPSTPPQEPHCCQHRRRPHHFYTAVGAPPPPQEPPHHRRHRRARPFCCHQTPRLCPSIDTTAIGHPRRRHHRRSSAIIGSLHLFRPSHRYITHRVSGQAIGMEHLLSWWMILMKGRPHGPGGRWFLDLALDLFLIRSIGDEMRTRKIRRIVLGKAL
jgi:hypothetical protein